MANPSRTFDSTVAWSDERHTWEFLSAVFFTPPVHPQVQVQAWVKWVQRIFRGATFHVGRWMVTPQTDTIRSMPVERTDFGESLSGERVEMAGKEELICSLNQSARKQCHWTPLRGACASTAWAMRLLWRADLFFRSWCLRAVATQRVQFIHSAPRPNKTPLCQLGTGKRALSAFL